MERIVLRHMSGSKADQEDRFPLDGFREITLGRDPSSSVRFGEKADPMVGRRHARITRNPALPSLFLITDLGSRNGTFVNQQRVFGTASLKPGDVVQCGIGGPEFRLDVEPETERLNTAPSPAETADLIEQMRARPASPKPPSIASHGASDGPSAGATVTPAGAAQSSAPAEGPSRKRAIGGGAVLIGSIALVVGYIGYRSLRSNNLSEAGKPGVTPRQNASPDAGAEKDSRVHFSGGLSGGLSGAADEAEKDAQRAAWRIEVAPYLTLGSGRPGNTASAFNKPAGVAFSSTGQLFATDDGNHRVQVWDVKTGSRLAEFSHSVFGDEIADIAIAPDNQALVLDRARGLAYEFTPPRPGAAPGVLETKGKPFGPYDYQFKGVRLGNQGLTKIGGLTVDSKARVYVVDALGNDVLRFNADGAPDKAWKFDKSRADGDTYLHGSEGIAIDEAGGNLFVASEKDAVIEVFDWETGAHKNRLVGASKDNSGKPAGKRVFLGPVTGLTVARQRLLAVDNSAGHIQIFDLAGPDAFNTDLAGYGAPQSNRSGRASGYQGFLGHAPRVDFGDETNTELQRQVKAGSIIPGQTNPPGHFCSPGAIASHTDRASGETYIAVTDQCNYRIVVYQWSDIAKALGIAEPPTGATLAANEAKIENKTALAVAGKPPGAFKKNVTPSRGRVTSSAGGKAANISGAKVTNAGGRKTTRFSNDKTAGASGGKGSIKGGSGKSEQINNNVGDATISGKKAKKAKKEKKVKY